MMTTGSLPWFTVKKMKDDQNNEDHIGKALGLANLEETSSKVVETMIAEGHNDSAKKDFEYARGNLMQVIEDSRDAIQTLAQIADSSQHPRAFEVLAKLCLLYTSDAADD